MKEGGAVIMLFDMNRDNYSILFTPIEGDSINNAVAFTSNFAKQKFTNPSLIICSTGMNKKQEYFDGETFKKS
jgi:hypothetical protein